MSAALTLAGPEHLDRVLGLVAGFHTETGIESTETSRLNAIEPLLAGVPHGSVYLIGPPRAAIGYIVISFGWSVEFGGLDGMIDEFFIRSGVRGRGIGSEVLLTLPKALAEHAGLRALHLEVNTEDAATQRLYKKTGFRLRKGYQLMTREF